MLSLKVTTVSYVSYPVQLEEYYVLMIIYVTASLTSKLASSLEHREGDTLPDSTPLIDFGMDSLVAVEIRSWFGQELEVDMPVLKSKLLPWFSI